MVFKQIFEEDIVDATGVVKGASAPRCYQGRRTLFSISLRDSPRSRSMGHVISGTHTAGAKICRLS
jgi:hypothetical protein